MIFVSQYVNTGLMLLLTNGKFEGGIAYFISNDVMGDYPDFTDDWYLNVGPQLVNTMLVAAFMPYISFAISYLIKFVARTLDSNKCLGNGKTRKVTV